MPLARGARIGPYEVLTLLGAGGMGEVYRARDVKLQRDVAIKVLPDSVAGDSERLARFEREARTLAALNHPNIAHVHGLEDRAIVMELVEGDDLSARLLRGGIPVDEALPIAKQIAQALEGAHDVGIVHRDLKPANIKLRADGTVKVLDFGLAKATDWAGGAGEELLNSPTFTSPAMTGAGVILGTAAYMSPEQARGKPVDKRADIWAFGVVLYEMLAGRRAFPGDTVTDVLAAVVTREPDWSLLPDDTPPAIRHLLDRCLRKDPKRRLHDIADARIEIDDAIDAPSPTANKAQRKSRLAIGGAIVVAGLVAALAMALAKLFAPETAPPGVSVTRVTDLAGLEETPALSPDGKSVAFTAAVGGTRQVYVQLLAGGAPLPLTREAVDHHAPRWSPDSSSIIYFSGARAGENEGAIWEVSALGGPARRITSALGGFDVSPFDGRLTFFRLANQKIELVVTSRDGSSVQRVAEFPPVRYYLYPRWSPDGRWIAFQRGDSIRFDLFMVPSSGGESQQLTRENNMMAGLAWLPDSASIVYSSSHGSTMPYLPNLSLRQLSVRDGTVSQLTSGEMSYITPDVAKDGSIAAARMQLKSDVWRFPANGAPKDNMSRAIPITRQTGHVLTPTASPDDKEIAFLSDSGGHANLWVVNHTSGELRQITYERDPTVAVGVPVWSPAGDAIAFVYTRGNPGLTFGVWLVNPDGSNLRQLANPALGLAWSDDGRWLYYSTRGGTTPDDVVLKKMPAAGGTPITVTSERLRNVIGTHGSTLYYMFERSLVDGTPEFEIRAATPDNGPYRVVARISPSRVPAWQIVNPALSPDGAWLAQALTDGFTTNIWASSTATGEWRQITDFGDRATFIARRVSWSADGHSIFAAVGDGDADIVLMRGLLNIKRE